MRTAVVYDYIPSLGGGAERVLLELLEHFSPEVDLYVGFIVDSPFSREYLEKIRKMYPLTRVYAGPKISFLKPLAFRICNYLLPSLLQKYRFEEYGAVVSYTSFLAHAIQPPLTATHIVYMNTPARFLWNLQHATSLLKRLSEPLFITDFMRFFFRLFDLDGLREKSHILAISKTTQERIATFYNRTSALLYPPGYTANEYEKEYYSRELHEELGDFYIHTSRIESYKNIDLLVDFAKQRPTFNKKIVLVGDGPYRHTLEQKIQRTHGPLRTQMLTSLGITVKTAGPFIITGFTTEETKKSLFATATASFSLNDEDFGITKIESLALGTPVIALSAGASPEIIHHGENGVLFPELSVHSLSEAIKLCEQITFSRSVIKASAQPFSTATFHANLDAYIRHAGIR